MDQFTDVFRDGFFRGTFFEGHRLFSPFFGKVTQRCKFMEESIEARVAPEIVWEAWERAHAKHGQGKLTQGQVGETKAEGKSQFRYKVLEVVPGKQFSILWKTLFVRLLFSHSVEPTQRGSQIRYSVQIKGPFAWPVRWVLGTKIRKNIGAVLKAIVKQLEEQSVKEARYR